MNQLKNLFIFSRTDYPVPGWRKWLALGNTSCLEFPGTGDHLPSRWATKREASRVEVLRPAWAPRPRCVLAWLWTWRCPPAIWPAPQAAALALSTAWTALSPDLHMTEKFRSISFFTEFRFTANIPSSEKPSWTTQVRMSPSPSRALVTLYHPGKFIF